MAKLSLSPSPSEVSSNHKVLALRFRISSRCRRLRIYLTNNPSLLEISKARFLSEIALLDSLVTRLDAVIVRLDNYNIVCNVEYLAVRRLWLSYPSKFCDHVIRLSGSFNKYTFSFTYFLDVLRRKRDYLLSKGRSVLDVDRLMDFEKDFSDLFKSFCADLAESSRLGRRSETLSRLGIESDQLLRAGWYCVFNSLTVSPEYLSKVFCRGSSYWTDYIRSVDRHIGIAGHGSWRSALDARRRGDDFHRYFAVVERGGLTGRLHIHVLHYFKFLPSDFVDPNLGMSIPYYREVNAFRRFWPWGNSSPKAVRYSSGDAFSVRGWIWPTDRLSQPLVARSHLSVVSYVHKYLVKSPARPDRKDGCIWRLRMSRNLGLSPLRMRLSRLSMTSRIQLLRAVQVPRSLTISQIRLPRRLFRRLLFRMIPLKLLVRVFHRVLLKSPMNLLVVVRNLLRKIQGFSPLSFGGIPISVFRLRVVSEFFLDPVSVNLSITGVCYAV